VDINGRNIATAQDNDGVVQDFSRYLKDLTKITYPSLAVGFFMLIF
jgi:hypothetical protein